MKIRTLMECDCGYEEERSRPYPFCVCGRTVCGECRRICEWCAHEGCTGCMYQTDDGWFCGVQCAVNWVKNWNKKMTQVDQMIARMKA